MAFPIDVSVIIVNFRSVHFLRKALASLNDNPSDFCCEVIVVDNASGDKCGEMLGREFPAVHFIPSDDNVGFSRGNNLGFSYASGRYALFLNPDTEVLGRSIDRMVRFLDAERNVGIVGPKLLNSDHSLQTPCIRAFPTILNEVVDSDLLRKWFPRSTLWGSGPLLQSNGKPTPVDAVSGASLMIRRETFEAVGMFSSCYFMYAEDLDLCFKARKQGWRTYFLPEATVIHHGHQSTRAGEDRHFADVLLRESRLHFFRRHRGGLYSSIYKLSTACTALCRMMLLRAALILKIGGHKQSLSRALVKWSRIFRWCIGMEQWVKNVK